MNFWVMLYRLAWIVVLVCCAIAVLCVFVPRAHNHQELQKRKRTVEENNARLESRIRELDEKQQRFRSDPEFVERIAREQGMAKPGETIFRFSTSNTVSGKRP
jgi:cell division protein FtsB